MTSETQEIWLLDFKPTVTRYERLPRRLRTREAVKRLSTFAAIVIALLALSAQPAQARPIIDPPEYYGPITAAHFAGRTATACIPLGVFTQRNPCGAL